MHKCNEIRIHCTVKFDNSISNTIDYIGVSINILNPGDEFLGEKISVVSENIQNIQDTRLYHHTLLMNGSRSLRH